MAIIHAKSRDNARTPMQWDARRQAGFTSGMPGYTSVFVLPDDLSASNPELLIANYPVDATQDIRQLTLRPFEARVYRLR